MMSDALTEVTIPSPVGALRLLLESERVCAIDFMGEAVAADETIELAVVQQLNAYFTTPQPLQAIPHQPAGTPFQQKVWRALCEIPLGRVITYGALAKQLESSPRAVGGACRANPIPLIIPCHRVVSQSGIGGFSGQWREGERVGRKRWLLRHEGVQL